MTPPPGYTHLISSSIRASVDEINRAKANALGQMVTEGCDRLAEKQIGNDLEPQGSLMVIVTVEQWVRQRERDSEPMEPPC